MSRKDDFRGLISVHQKRLSILTTTKARFGFHTPSHIILEIEETEKAIKQCYEELENIGVCDDNDEADSRIKSRQVNLIDSMERLTSYHELIVECKELHNLLQDLHNTTSQLFAKADRLLDTLNGNMTKKTLRRQWQPCQKNIERLKRFAEQIKYIYPNSYCEENEELVGPPWIVNIVVLQKDIEVLLRKGDLNIDSLYDTIAEFYNACDTELYLADKNLRDEAGKLYQLASHILIRLT